jgi:general secretion pathway protein H
LSKHTFARGFTLVEMLLVITIIVAATAVVAPNLTSGNQASILKGAARDLGSAMRFARGQALTTHQDSLVSINLEENTYQVTGREKTYQLNNDIDITLSVAQTESDGTGTGSVRFFSDGSSSGGRVTLELAEMKQTLDINWLTGQIESNAEE